MLSIKTKTYLIMHLDMSPSCAMADVPVILGSAGFFNKDSKYEHAAYPCSISQDTLSTVENRTCIYSHAHEFTWLLCISTLKVRPPVIPSQSLDLRTNTTTSHHNTHLPQTDYNAEHTSTTTRFFEALVTYELNSN